MRNKSSKKQPIIGLAAPLKVFLAPSYPQRGHLRIIELTTDLALFLLMTIIITITATTNNIVAKLSIEVHPIPFRQCTPVSALNTVCSPLTTSISILFPSRSIVNLTEVPGSPVKRLMKSNSLSKDCTPSIDCITSPICNPAFSAGPLLITSSINLF